VCRGRRVRTADSTAGDGSVEDGEADARIMHTSHKSTLPGLRQPFLVFALSLMHFLTYILAHALAGGVRCTPTGPSGSDAAKRQ
jgi:hypothetical protein